MAWLLPITIDAGAGVGCLVWLGRSTPPDAARFARGLTWSLLGGSVAGNAVVHGLSAYGLAAPWPLVVAVSAVAPAVLGAVVHLGVQMGQNDPSRLLPLDRSSKLDTDLSTEVDNLDERGLSRAWDEAPPAHPDPGGDAGGVVLVDTGRAGELIAAGASRRRLARELGVSEHSARLLIEQHTANGSAR